MPIVRAIDDCYAAFEHYPAPTSIEVSPLRDPVAIFHMLTSAPLRELTAVNLVQYASAAMTSVGTVDDYRYFLPRIIETATLDARIDPEMIALKLRSAGLESWPATERRAIEAAFRAIWREMLSIHTDNRHADCWLCAMAIIDMPLQEELEYFGRAAGINPCLQLATMITSTFFENDKIDRAYWSELSENSYRLIDHFLRSDLVKIRLSTPPPSCKPNDQWMINKARSRLDELSRRTLH